MLIYDDFIHFDEMYFMGGVEFFFHRFDELCFMLICAHGLYLMCFFMAIQSF